MKNQFVTDNQGQKIAVILPIKDYKKMMDDLDEYACIVAYGKVKARNQEFIKSGEMFNAIELSSSGFAIPVKS